jgi:DNA-binding NarL/FixJ family response regulator
MKLIRVVLADDHTLMRAGIRSLCESVPGVKVVAEAGDGNAALEMVRAHLPDVVLMDINMPQLSGLAAASRVQQEFPEVRVIMLTMHAGEDFVQAAFKAGASGYLLKDSAPPELELALRAVMRGETYLSPEISQRVLRGYVERAGAGDGAQAVLTARQSEILKLIAEGHATKQIAHQLGISAKTVETHRAHIMKRLKIGEVASLVRYAIRIGLVGTNE